MKQPQPILFGYSWLGILNMAILQWLFIRLQATVENGQIVKFKVIGPVVPLTGWWSPYVFLGKNNT
jgi:hypothetical protein